MQLYRNHFAKVSFFVGSLLPFPVCALGGHLVGEVIVIAGAGTGTGIGTVTGTERVLRARIALATHTHTQRAASRMPYAVCRMRRGRAPGRSSRDRSDSLLHINEYQMS